MVDFLIFSHKKRLILRRFCVLTNTIKYANIDNENREKSSLSKTVSAEKK